MPRQPPLAERLSGQADLVLDGFDDEAGIPVAEDALPRAAGQIEELGAGPPAAALRVLLARGAERAAQVRVEHAALGDGLDDALGASGDAIAHFEAPSSYRAGLPLHRPVSKSV